ncbi:bifunctional alpha,alpha-trehalose-phosphate synthase (UDP-forming)/trehalose-phosphatase [Brachybacterium alimentarium]|uniref:bifunctional alpha,alpha-trehalose-phosphate synthase (UDP-forming)/trehalose-phosphatase n=1 Tax=Brachybacterium alimentarium TaxID=47845 RepID=UPI000DF2783F|nr:bifunctional alpha,alpha-trehalose-phosphate synthase (UDP-forming)/trehalose-phosphatase [Brachybacterium alimentarium]RCS68551.1 bifunctional alpha,alpha-trehalose-phosphate synthase (UDP-forming)/trehalose-phosphatase [Brachybacterium alimentarium]RCS77609.1 bifunctional alpha,alpha-trehalose-phosphate synthase (UDP-forming)/trehalose-phosphatase [Brachybacterium alimentarium]RCS78388.1 bifunctional alpha,alpha-trehalose-phosphate synthase (UDP-forming)/trehalose-phosphatase [Brachybacteri
MPGSADRPAHAPHRPDHDLVVVANRLPVDSRTLPDGATEWVTSPGGLVTAMESVMKGVDSGAWVGWAGAPGDAPDPFEADGMSLYPVALDQEDIERYYEGFSNGTLWPLYHDVIVEPAFHRTWWDSYVSANRRFARAAAAVASRTSTIWVHDYQLQLVPRMIRDDRADVRIGFFNHIPFPPVELFSQLPKRNQILRGLLGADLIGFQRESDTQNFLAAVRKLLGHHVDGQTISVPGLGAAPMREVTAQTFPISIDSASVSALTEDPEVREHAAQLRRDLGNPRKVVVGVDRLDYTKGIRHRLKAWGELLNDGSIDPHDTVMIQVATPSRERVEAYRQLRDEVELTVGRINGDHASIGRAAVSYQHRSFDRRYMTALYMAADVVLVTALRDGMNLVAKEYVASRPDLQGVLVLSEFAGAADELRAAVMVNPHDIDELKAAILRSLAMPEEEQQESMRSLRHQVMENDVQSWAHDFLERLEQSDDPHGEAKPVVRLSGGEPTEPEVLEGALAEFAQTPRILIASDFDGVLAPIVNDRDAVEPDPAALDTLRELADMPGVAVALISGRSLEDLDSHTGMPSSVVLVGSHGAEVGALPPWMQAEVLDSAALSMTPEKDELLQSITATLHRIARAHPGVEVETKPSAAVLHTRNARGRGADNATDSALEYAVTLPEVTVTPGKEVVEFSVVHASKGDAIDALARASAADAWLYLGDDVTDESVFGHLGESDCGIKVGEGDTAANYRIAGTPEAAAVLARLKALRQDG